jgi:hypothetical protein
MQLFSLNLTPLVFALSVLSFGVHSGDALPGAGENLKSWNSVNTKFENVKNGARPVCLYVYIPAKKAHADAIAMEGAEFLGHADVKKNLGKMSCIKLNLSPSPKAPGEIEALKSWPADLIEAAKAMKYGVIVLDAKMQAVASFSNKTEKQPRVFLNITDKLVNAAEIERKKKAEEEKLKEAKLAELQKIEDAKKGQVGIKIKGLGGEEVDENGNPKKAPEKKPEVKKPVIIDE